MLMYVFLLKNQILNYFHILPKPTGGGGEILVGRAEAPWPHAGYSPDCSKLALEYSNRFIYLFNLPKKPETYIVI